ncbi:hypothetical protein ACFOTA_18905 [Chitinophaga sp. GCM10012297]|uniref:Gliding motility-associated C-terminal domain-containing protein n=1 Tax=Chitinophaga chungangae TaxID=2821488 RepID=A0ABS3YHX4_9BACT|nr:hypothetical protein [Chitinophaga chungangae]MBO9154293.1 hypothetical protein [Chitinophaga chungangae]
MKVYIVAIALLAAISCSRDPQVEYNRTQGQVTSNTFTYVPRAGQVNTMDIKFSLENSCSIFDSFESHRDGDTLIIKVWGLTPKDVGCTKEIRYHTKPFKYAFPAPGTYYLKFARNNGLWHRDTVTVLP